MSRDSGFTSLMTVIAIAVVALVVGYFLGFSIGKKEGSTASQQLTPTPGVDTGYQNPFEGVKLNPFR